MFTGALPSSCAGLDDNITLFTGKTNRFPEDFHVAAFLPWIPRMDVYHRSSGVVAAINLFCNLLRGQWQEGGLFLCGLRARDCSRDNQFIHALSPPHGIYFALTCTPRVSSYNLMTEEGLSSSKPFAF